MAEQEQEQSHGDGDHHLPRRRISLQEQLGFSSPCGSQEHVDHQQLVEHVSNVICVSPSPRMNLADALAAERQESRSTVPLTFDHDNPHHHENNNTLTLSSSTIMDVTSSETLTSSVTPPRVSLMRLLEETDDKDEKDDASVSVSGSSLELVCCVCMGRKKGAAFIPCGHTFCRVCSRELWLNRGSCPLCNRSILDILDIF